MSEWISVSDEMPEIGAQFQGWFVCDGDGFWEPHCTLNDDGVVGIYGRVDYDTDDFDYGLTHLTMTHWMPLPEPPKD